MKFVCDKCNYSTNRSDNFKRHLLTKKHIKNIKNIKNSKPVNTFVCDFCYKKYSYLSNLCKHKKVCEKKSIMKLENKIKKITHNNINNNININIHNTYNNIINVLMKEYPNAPSIMNVQTELKELSDIDMQKCIDLGVPKGVILYIKKALLNERERKDMSFWSIDAARNKYAVKEDIWKTDLHGVSICDTILPRIRDIFIEYSAKKNKQISNIPHKTCNDMECMSRCLNFILNIRKREDKIIRNLAGHVKFRV